MKEISCFETYCETYFVLFLFLLRCFWFYIRSELFQEQDKSFKVENKSKSCSLDPKHLIDWRFFGACLEIWVMATFSSKSKPKVVNSLFIVSPTSKTMIHFNYNVYNCTISFNSNTVWQNTVDKKIGLGSLFHAKS